MHSQQLPLIALLGIALLLASCAQSIDPPPMIIVMRDFEGRRAAGFVPDSEPPQEVEVVFSAPVGDPRNTRVPLTDRQREYIDALVPGAVRGDGAPEGDLWITSRRQGNLTSHSGDVTGTSVRNGDRTFHSIDGTMGTTHHMGRVSITNFGDTTGMTTRVGDVQIHSFSDGSRGMTTTFGNQSTTTINH